MDIIFTYHAKIQLKRRKIEEVWVTETVRYPNMLKKKGIKN